MAESVLLDWHNLQMLRRKSRVISNGAHVANVDIGEPIRTLSGFIYTTDEFSARMDQSESLDPHESPERHLDSCVFDRVRDHHAVSAG